MTFAQALARLADLAQQEKLTRFEMGDIALDQVPYALDGVNNGSQDKLERMADASGLTLTQLEQRRFTSSRVPPTSRVVGVSWSVYREIANEGIAEERARLLDLVAQPHPTNERGRWTVTSLRVEMGRPPIQHTGSEPLAQRIQTAPLAERVAALDALRLDPEVRQEVRRQEEALARPPAAEDVPSGVDTTRVEQKLDLWQARAQMEAMLDRFIRDAAAVLPRITSLPDPAHDPWATAQFLRSRLASARTVIDRIESLLSTGKVGGDVDDFFAKVLSESNGGKA